MESRRSWSDPRAVATDTEDFGANVAGVGGPSTLVARLLPLLGEVPPPNLGAPTSTVGGGDADTSTKDPGTDILLVGAGGGGGCVGGCGLKSWSSGGGGCAGG